MKPSDTWSLDLSLGFLLSRAARSMKRALDARLTGWNLTATQYIVLVRLWEQDGISFSELGDRLDFDNPTLTGVIDRMERDGLVERRRCHNDRRVIRVHVTANGHNLRQEIGLFAAEVDLAALTELTAPQQKQILKDLRNIWQTLHD